MVTLAYYISEIPFQQHNYSVEKNEHEMKDNRATARALNVLHCHNSRHVHQDSSHHMRITPLEIAITK